MRESSQREPNATFVTLFFTSNAVVKFLFSKYASYFNVSRFNSHAPGCFRSALLMLLTE